LGFVVQPCRWSRWVRRRVKMGKSRRVFLRGEVIYIVASLLDFLQLQLWHSPLPGFLEGVKV
jgi:hypothetical protein